MNDSAGYTRSATDLSGCQTEMPRSVEIQNLSGGTSDGNPSMFGAVVTSPQVHARKQRLQNRQRTIRRLRCFLIGFENGEARVGIVSQGQVTEYFLPEKSLRASRVIEPGQPFEINEYEEVAQNGFRSITEIKAMAKAGTGITGLTALDDTQKELRNAILAYKAFEPNV